MIIAFCGVIAKEDFVVLKIWRLDVFEELSVAFVVYALYFHSTIDIEAAVVVESGD